MNSKSGSRSWSLAADEATKRALHTLSQTRPGSRESRMATAYLLLIRRTEERAVKAKSPPLKRRIISIKEILQEVACSRQTLGRWLKAFDPSKPRLVTRRKSRVPGVTPEARDQLESACLRGEIRTGKAALAWLETHHWSKSPPARRPSPATLFRWIAPFVQREPMKTQPSNASAGDGRALAQKPGESAKRRELEAMAQIRESLDRYRDESLRKLRMFQRQREEDGIQADFEG